MDVPDIPSVNLKTSYLEMKDILEETRKTVQESHLVDSNTARIVDNPGGTRSIVVVGNEINQTGTSSNPYKMRDRRYGSANPTDTSGPLGLDQANTDTWDRFTPPIYNETAMDGVTIGELPRHYISSSSGTYEEKIFDRLKKYDSSGELYSVGIEVLVETATISGSASKGGGI